jgi:hypothetical protein
LLTGSQASVTNTWSAGEILNAADLNQNFTDIVNAANAIDNDNVSDLAAIVPTKLDDRQSTDAQAQLQTDPYPAGAFQRIASMALEIQQIRYQLSRIAIQDNTYWYEDLDNVGFSTGDVKLTIKTSADTGWVMMIDRSIGNASSGGTERANADTEDLFTLLWTNLVNVRTISGTVSIDPNSDGAGLDTITTGAAHGLSIGDQVYFTNVTTTPDVDTTTETVTSVPSTTTFDTTTDITAAADPNGNWTLNLLQTSAGVPTTADPNGAAADYAANRRIMLPSTLGRVLAISDPNAAGLAPGAVAHPLGGVGGSGTETHTLTTAQMPAHTHVQRAYGSTTTAGSVGIMGGNTTNDNTVGNTVSTGGGGSFNNWNPATFLNVMIKL